MFDPQYDHRLLSQSNLQIAQLVERRIVANVANQQFSSSHWFDSGSEEVAVATLLAS